jgi:uncharacterized protein YcfJ
MKKILSTLVLTGLVTSTFAGQFIPVNNNTITIPVIEAKKIMEEVTIKKKQRTCWDEKVTVKIKQEGEAGAQLFGALLGGVIGHQFGGGTGKAVATGVGAVVGSEVARNAHNDGSEQMYEDKIVKKCKTEYIPHTELVFSHYENKAQFLGKTIIKRTQQPLREIVISYSY